MIMNKNIIWKNNFMFIRDKNTLDKEMPNIIRTCQGLLDNSKNGIDIKIKKHTVKRSNLQNSFYWLNCNDIAKCLDNAGCEYKVITGVKLPYTKDIIHQINIKVFDVKTTTKMSTGEFCEYMEKMFAFWQQRTKYNWVPLESPVGYAERTGLINNKN